jgi:DNA-binding transcriptional regulator YiaG
MEYSNHMTGLEFTAFRMRKNLSQSELALLLGVSVVTVKAWEHERRNIPLQINNFIRLSIAHAPPEALKAMVERLKNFEKRA